MHGALAFALLVLFFQTDAAPAQQHAETYKTGFVYCSEPNQTAAPVFLDACNQLRVGSLKCGDEVQVLERETDYFKVAPADKLERYMTQDSVSQMREKFVALADVHESKPPPCKIIKTPKREAPSAIYSPDPDYSEQALKKGLQGTVALSLVVDESGVPRDVRVTKSLGMGLDQEAVKAVKRWRFKPALQDGKPVAVPVTVNVDFRLATIWHR